MIGFHQLDLYRVNIFFMLISMKRLHRYFPLIDFPIKDLSSLHDFARDFVISYFEIYPKLNRHDWQEEKENFLQRMTQELRSAIGDEQSDKLLNWIQGWPMNEALENDVTWTWQDIPFSISRRKEGTEELIENLDKDTLEAIDGVINRYFERVQPVLDELEAIIETPCDNWEYMIHYMYCLDEIRDGTRVTIDISPIDWLESMISTMEECADLREIKAVLSPEALAAIDVWLKKQSFWKDKMHGSFEEWLNDLDSNCPCRSG